MFRVSLSKLLVFLLLITLFFGNTFDFFWELPVRPLDLVMMFVFLNSLFLPEFRNRNLDLFAALFFVINFSLLVINSKYLLSISSFFYLIRLAVYILSYPFFIYIFKEFKYQNTVEKMLPLFMLFHIAFFGFNSQLKLQGYDPHVGRLYGPFLDPNYYAVLLVIFLSFYVSKNKWSRGDLFSVLLTLVSLFLTYSRIGLLLMFILFLLQLMITKNLKYLSIFVGFLLVSLTSFKYVSRILFLEGNLDSFILRIQSYLDGVLMYSNAVIPFGFNNIEQSSFFLTSNLNMSSSYTDSIVFNLVLTGGLINLFLFTFGIYFIGTRFAKINMKVGAYTLLSVVFASFIQNVVFHPYFLVILIALFSYSLSTKKDVHF